MKNARVRKKEELQNNRLRGEQKEASSPGRRCQDLMSSGLGEKRKHGREDKGRHEEDADADDVGSLDIQRDR